MILPRQSVYNRQPIKDSIHKQYLTKIDGAVVGVCSNHNVITYRNSIKDTHVEFSWLQEQTPATACRFSSDSHVRIQST
jgi:hypothetical protein